MAYDERLADEIRERLALVEGEVTEKRMFGGLAFMVDGKLAVAASHRGGLLARTDPAEVDETLALPGAEPMEMRGRPVPGWVHIDAEALAGDADLDAWIERALAFVATLPPK